MSDVTAVAVERQNPFPGLRPFREDEEQLFFGRENQVDAMVDKLARSRFLAVVGTSGSGKSSLVNCGLRPALRRGLMASAGTAWRMAQFRPGSSPIREMARALAGNGVLFREHEASGLTLAEIVETTLRMSNLGLVDISEQARLNEDVNLLVVVDQFEELFRYRGLASGRGGQAAGPDEEATAFVNLLLEAGRQRRLPIHVVLTMRSDFLGDCAQFGGLAEAINDGQYLIPRLTRDERRAVIRSPIRMRGAEISPVLLTRLVNDVGDNPDQLSILQHALNRTWARWENERGAQGPLGLEDYEAIGTMRQALDLHAEEAFAELETPRQKRLCEKLFKTLTDKATDTRGIRRPTRLGTLCDVARATAAELTEVMAVFREPTRSFLMPPVERPEAGSPGPGAAGVSGDLGPDTDVDISHESLMRVWERLLSWAEQERQSAEQYLLLARDAERHAKGEVGLLDQPALGLFVKWRRDTAPTEAWAELYKPTPDGRAVSFFAQAMEYLDASERHEKARRRKRFWSVAGAFAALAIVAAFIGFLYLVAEEQRARAEQQQYLSDIRLARAELGQGELVRAAEALWRTPDGRRNWEWGYLLRKSYGLKLGIAEGRLVDAAFGSAPDRPLVAAGSAAGTVAMWDSVSGEPLLSEPLQACDPGVWTGVRLSADGGRLLTICDKPRDGDRFGPTRIWDTASGEPLAEIDWQRRLDTVHLTDGRVLAFGKVEDGEAGIQDRVEIWQWDAADPAARPWPLPAAQEISAAAFCGGSERLATGSEAGGVELWDLDTRAVLGEAPLGAPRGHDGKVWAIACSPDGGRLITGSADGTARVWSVAPGPGRLELWDTLPHPGQVVTHVALSADGRLAVTVAGYEARVWVLGGSSEADRAPAAVLPDVRADRAVFSSDGRQVLVDAVGEAVLWSWKISETSSPRAFKMAQADTVQAAFGPGDSRLLTRFPGEAAVRVWQSAPSVVDACWEFDSRVRAVAPTAGGVLVATSDGQIVARRTAGCPAASSSQAGETADGAGAFPLTGHEKKIGRAAFSRDGRKLVTSSSDTTQVWAAGKPGEGGWELAFGLPPIGRTQSTVFSPDGALLVIATDEPRRASIWDAVSGSEEPVAQTGEHEARVSYAALDPSGRLVVTASEDGTARIWDAATGVLRQPLEADDGPVVFASFSPDGQRVVTAAGNLARVWSAASGEAEASLVGHAGPVTWADFSPDGSRLFTASDSRDDGTVRIWDLDGNELAVLDDFERPRRVRFAGAPSRLLAVGPQSRNVAQLTVLPFRREDLPGDPAAGWEEGIGLSWRDLARAGEGQANGPGARRTPRR